MPPTFLLAAVGPDLFAWTFGSEWREAGVFVRILAPMLYFQFIFSPISMIFSILGKQEKGFFLHGTMISTRGLSLTIGAYFGGLRLAVILFSLGSVLSYIVFLGQAFKVSGVCQIEMAKQTLHNFLYCALAFLPTFACFFLDLSSWIKISSFMITFFILIPFCYFPLSLKEQAKS